MRETIARLEGEAAFAAFAVTGARSLKELGVEERYIAAADEALAWEDAERKRSGISSLSPRRSP